MRTSLTSKLPLLSAISMDLSVATGEHVDILLFCDSVYLVFDVVVERLIVAKSLFLLG